jgi:hypothetical protein
MAARFVRLVCAVLGASGCGELGPKASGDAGGFEDAGTVDSGSLDAASDAPDVGVTDSGDASQTCTPGPCPEPLLKQFDIGRMVLGPTGLVTRTHAEFWPQWTAGEGRAGIFEIPHDTLTPRSIIESSGANGYALLIVNDTIYAADRVGDLSEGNALWSIGIDGTNLTVLVPGLGALDLATDGTYAYLTHSVKDEVYRVPLAGGSPELLATAVDPSAVAVDATHAYWMASGRLQKMPLGGGAATDLAIGEQLAAGIGPTRIEIHDGHAYWVGLSTPCPPCNYGVRRVAIDGGPVQTLPFTTHCADYAVDPAFVYCTTGTGIARIPVAGTGGEDVLLEIDWNLPSYVEFPPSTQLIAVSATHIYFTVGGAITGGLRDADVIYRIPKP